MQAAPCTLYQDRVTCRKQAQLNMSRPLMGCHGNVSTEITLYIQMLVFIKLDTAQPCNGPRETCQATFMGRWVVVTV